jgi:hypothetical protein
MENLVIKHKERTIFTIGLGCMWIVSAVIYLVVDEDPLDKADWNKSITIFIMGILILIQPFLGLTRSKIKIREGYLFIWFMGWLSPRKIKESEIERIILGERGIKIFRTGKKPVSVFLYNMEKAQKEEVYRFFTEYARQNNFTS